MVPHQRQRSDVALAQPSCALCPGGSPLLTSASVRQPPPARALRIRMSCAGNARTVRMRRWLTLAHELLSARSPWRIGEVGSAGEIRDPRANSRFVVHRARPGEVQVAKLEQ